MKKLNNKAGYTLVEMVLVIAIIVMLAVVLITGIVDEFPVWKAKLDLIGAKRGEALDIINDPSLFDNNFATGTFSPDEEDGSTSEQLSHDAVVNQLGSLFTNNLRQGDLSTLGKLIVSNKPVQINQMLRDNNIDNAYAFVTNDSNVGRYVTTVLSNNGISANTSYAKIISVTTDGTVLSDHNRNDTVPVIQYMYYEEKINGVKYAVLYGYREVEATITSVSGNGSIVYDRSDTDGSSWTVVG